MFHLEEAPMKYLHQDLTEQIIKCFYDVYNELGYGFLEKVYERSMMIELAQHGLSCRSQCPIEVLYKTEFVGEYFSDIIVENCIIIEVKAAETLVEAHELQLINHLKATSIEIGLLLNFGKKPGIRRKIFTNDRKEREHR